MDFKTEVTKVNQSKLQNCIDIANNVLKIGEFTAAELDKQEQQLDRIDGTVDTIDNNVVNAHRTLDNIASFFKSLLGSVRYSGRTDTDSVKTDNAIDKPEKTDVVEQTDDKLDELFNLTNRMKEMSININKAIDRQTEKIQHIGNKTDDTNDNIKLANNKIDKLL